jgi:hypothetical protein
MVSEPYTILTADLDNTVYLSPPSGSGRPENGTTEWQLFGNVLSFTVTVNDLGPGDRLSYGHVHTNGPAEDDPRLLTLFGDPIDPVRSYEPPFPSGAAITASIFLTPDEVSALSDPGNLCYIDVHFKNGGNLVEGAGPI